MQLDCLRDFNFPFSPESVMRGIFTLLIFLASFAGTITAGVVMLYEVLQPNIDGAHFACAAIGFFLMAIFFLFVRDEVEY